MSHRVALSRVLVAMLAFRILLVPDCSWAHCDSLNGPVVSDARLALEEEDPTAVLKWVRKDDENEIREVFQKVLEVRKTTPKAKELAERYFFETLVRIHRAGEGEAFTGLKPAETVHPAILAADRALEQGTAKELSSEISTAIRDEIDKRLERASALKKTASSSVQAGRQFVRAYVEYIHFVEAAHDLAGHSADHGH